MIYHHVFFKNSGGNGVSATKLLVLTVPKNVSEFRSDVGKASALIRPHIYLCSPADRIRRIKYCLRYVRTYFNGQLYEVITFKIQIKAFR